MLMAVEIDRFVTPVEMSRKPCSAFKMIKIFHIHWLTGLFTSTVSTRVYTYIYIYTFNYVYILI